MQHCGATPVWPLAQQARRSLLPVLQRARAPRQASQAGSQRVRVRRTQLEEHLLLLRCCRLPVPPRSRAGRSQGKQRVRLPRPLLLRHQTRRRGQRRRLQPAGPRPMLHRSSPVSGPNQPQLSLRRPLSPPKSPWLRHMTAMALRPSRGVVVTGTRPQHGHPQGGLQGNPQQRQQQRRPRLGRQQSRLQQGRQHSQGRVRM
jgi:hypothetical protein